MVSAVFFSDKITKEVLLCDNAQIIPLSDTPAQWAMTAVDMAQYRNDNAINQVRAKGFDIYDQAIELNKFYDSIW